jgi:hypothetical protein
MHPYVLQVLTQSRLFAIDNEVLAAKCQRIHVELAGDLVDVGLQSEHV